MLGVNKEFCLSCMNIFENRWLQESNKELVSDFFLVAEMPAP